MTHFSIRADILRAVSMAVSTDETRYYLNGIFAEPHEAGGVRVVATNGHLMAVFHDRFGAAPRPVIISADWKAKVLKQPARESGLRRLCFSRDEDGPATVSAGVHCYCSESKPLDPSVNKPIEFLTVSEIEASYPEYTRAIPAHGMTGPRDAFAFDAALIGKIATAARAMGHDPRLSFSMKSRNDPAVVVVNGLNDGFFVLMPMRVPEDPLTRNFHSWLMTRRPEAAE